MAAVRHHIGQRPCLTFVLLVVMTPYVILLPLLAIGVEASTLRPLKLPFAVTPLVYALLVTWCREGEQGGQRLLTKLRLAETRPRWYLVALLSFVVPAMLALVIRFSVDGFFPPRVEFASWSTIALLTPPLLLFPGITEEFAWRGFLQSRLQAQGRWWMASLIVGCVWATWHGFDFLLGNWTFEWRTFGGYPALMLSSSVIIGWVYFRGGESVGLAMLAHFSANAVNFYTPVFQEFRGSSLPAILYIGGLCSLAVLLPVVDRPWHNAKREVIYEQVG